MSGGAGDRTVTRRAVFFGAGAATATVAIGAAQTAAANPVEPGEAEPFALNVRHLEFGARGDGVTDDTRAIQTALLRAGDAGGGVVVIPAGIYLVSATLRVPEGVQVLGVTKRGAEVSTTSQTADVFALKHASGISDLKITSRVLRTAGSLVRIIGNSVFVTNCDFSSYYVGVTIGQLGAVQAVGVHLSDINFLNPGVASGGGAIHLASFSNAVVQGCVIVGTDDGPQPAFGIRVEMGDTALLSDTNITRHGRALLFDTPYGSGCFAVHVSNSLFDSSGSTIEGQITSCAEFSPQGGVYDTKFSNCWFGLSIDGSGCHVAPPAGGVVDGLTFTGCEFVQNAVSGLWCSGENVRNWVVTGGYSAGNPAFGIHVADGCGTFTITGHRAGPSAARGRNGIGIGIDAGPSDEYVIVGNNLHGNIAAALSDGGTGASKMVATNLL